MTTDEIVDSLIRADAGRKDIILRLRADADAADRVAHRGRDRERHAAARARSTHLGRLLHFLGWQTHSDRVTPAKQALCARIATHLAANGDWIGQMWS